MDVWFPYQIICLFTIRPNNSFFKFYNGRQKKCMINALTHCNVIAPSFFIFIFIFFMLELNDLNVLHGYWYSYIVLLIPVIQYIPCMFYWIGHWMMVFRKKIKYLEIKHRIARMECQNIYFYYELRISQWMIVK